MTEILRHAARVATATLLLPMALAAQEATHPKAKGVWEQVSYPADVYLTDAYFATPVVGWVSAGAGNNAGMIIHTKDAGNTWTVKLGDAESSDPAFHDLRFIDGQHGWVLQDPLEEEESGEYAESGASETEELAPDEAGGAGGEMSSFTATCCGKPLGKLDLVLTAVTGIVPQFLGQYKNTNLLVAGLRMLSDLPGRVNELNNAMRAFRKAPDKVAAQDAVARVAAAVQGLTQSTAVAFQKQLPPQPEESGVARTAVEQTETTEEAENTEETEDTEETEE